MKLTHGQQVLLLSLIGAGLLTALITWLLSRAGGGGTVIREQGPERHRAKAATPSTGGIGFMLALAIVGSYGAVAMTDPRGIIGVAGGLLTGLIGLADDTIKKARQDSAGLKARYKLPLQIVVGLLVAGATYYLLEDDSIRIPFLHVSVHLGGWKVIVGLFCYLTIINGVNFTDGIDGLAATTVLIAAVCLAGAIWTVGAGTAIVPVVIIGVCAGFLPFNRHPAKIFMGDSGAFSISGALAAAAIALGLEIALLIIGFVFIIELVSVVLQVVYFRLTGGKRLFRMTPIHHAWELRGAKEPAIVAGFAAVGVVCGAVGWWIC